MFHEVPLGLTAGNKVASGNILMETLFLTVISRGTLVNYISL
jgi:hypothetical protein